MKYLLHGDKGSPRNVLERITTPLSLFTHLRNRCLLSRDNILCLQGMLYQTMRNDLVKMLREYGRTRGNILHCYPEHDLESPDSDVTTQGIKLNEELDHCFQQTKSLQRQVEQYQMKEKTAETIESSASFNRMVSLTIIATLLFNILEQNNTTLDSIPQESINHSFKHTMEKVKSLGYNAEIIEELLDANSQVVRKHHLEAHRLYIWQQNCLIQRLQHSIGIARWERDRLKYALGMNLKDPFFSEQEPPLLQFTHIQQTHQIQVEVGIGINPELLKPVLEEMSSHLTDADKERLREAFRLRRQHEKMLKKEHNLCFIESLINIESQKTEGITLESFEQKLFKVVDRKDFEEKWRRKMTEFSEQQKHAYEFVTEQATKAKHKDETPHHKTDSEANDNGGNAKMNEVLEQVGLMMRRVMNIETLIKNPLANLDI